MELSLSHNKKFLVIDSCTELEYEQLKISLTKKIEGWRFHPLVKKRVWDGNISFIKRNKIPSGLWKEVVDICKEYDFKLSMNGITDLFNTDITESEFLDWVNDFFKDSEIKPRDYQIDAAFKILKYRRCLAELATSAGKTLISFMIVAYMMERLNKKKILFIVPNVSLVLQATGDFEEYNKSRIQLKIQQIYSGVKIRPSSNIVIGTYQSLVKKDEEYFNQFDVVMVDETHKAKANSIQKIMDKCWHCDYRFGLSGTIPKRGTVNRLSLMSAMGPLVTQVKANYLQDEGYIAKCKVLQIHMDYATVAQKESFAFLSKNPIDRQRLFSLEQNFINENEKRLDFVCQVVKKSTSNSLVLFHKIAYGEKLYQKLRSITDKKVYYVDGSINADLREEFKRRMEKNDDVIIVASYGTFSTGISIKNIHNIFFTESFKSEVIIRQSIGRGLRQHHSKDIVKIYDFIDDFRYKDDELDWMNYIYRHGQERRKIYKEEKFPFELQNIRF
jgi:superfamily II DNA or RNA helicase